MLLGCSSGEKMKEDLESTRSSVYKVMSQVASRSILEEEELIPEEKVVETSLKIGGGAFGIVVKGTYRGQVVALKKLLCAKSQPVAIEEAQELLSLSRKWKRLSHENILRLEGYFIQNFQPVLVMEICEMSLKHFLSIAVTPTSDKFLFVARGIASGLKYLHDMGLLHCDLKPENILVDRNLNVVKLIDFALVPFDRIFRMAKPKKVLGTRLYMSLDAIDGVWSPKSDVFALGLTCWQMLTNEYPWTEFRPKELDVDKFLHDLNDIEKTTLKDLHFQGKRPSFPKPCEEWQKELIDACWKPKPSSRPTPEMILKMLDAERKVGRVSNRFSRVRKSLRLSMGTLERAPKQRSSSQRIVVAPWQLNQSFETMFLADLMGWSRSWTPEKNDDSWKRWTEGTEALQLRKQSLKALVKLLSMEDLFAVPRNQQLCKNLSKSFKEARVISRAIRKYDKHPLTCSEILALMENLDRSDYFPAKLVSDGFHEVLLNHIEKLKESARRRAWCCYLVGRIARDTSSDSNFDPVDASNVILKQLKKFPSSANLTGAILQSLGALAHFHQSTRSFLNAEGIWELLFLAFQKFPEEIVQCSACSLIAAFENLAPYFETCIKFRIPSYVFAAMENYGDSLRVQLQAVRAIFRFSCLHGKLSPSNIRHIFPSLLSAMAKFNENEEIQISIGELLKTMINLENDYLYSFVLPNPTFLEQLLNCMEQHPRQEVIQENSCYILEKVAAYESISNSQSSRMLAVSRASAMTFPSNECISSARKFILRSVGSSTSA